MQKLLTSLAASATLGLFVSSAGACDFHDMSMASSAPANESVVAMSTNAAATQQPPAAATAACPAGAKCAPAKN